MNTDEIKRYPLIDYLETQRGQHNRRVFAELRRGLGEAPGTVAEAYRHIVQYLSQDCDRWTERAYYLAATLFALHPQEGGAGISLGHALRQVRAKTESESIEHRFVALLNAHPDDIAEHLRHLISLIRSKNIPIDWHLLLDHLLHLRSESAYVQRQWARDFWTHASPTENPDTKGTHA